MLTWREDRANRASKPLTPTERKVVDELIKDGPTNAEIAKRLRVTENCIKVHFRHIMDKTGYGNRTEIAIKTLRRNFRILSATGREL
jgi:two-component system vancomycin resistance associated response regulator VraR